MRKAGRFVWESRLVPHRAKPGSVEEEARDPNVPGEGHR